MSAFEGYWPVFVSWIPSTTYGFHFHAKMTSVANAHHATREKLSIANCSESDAFEAFRLIFIRKIQYFPQPSCAAWAISRAVQA